MTRSTASRRARNSDSVMTGGRRRPESRPSLRRCRLASSRVEPADDLNLVADPHPRRGPGARARRCSAGRPARPDRSRPPSRGGACGGGGGCRRSVVVVVLGGRASVLVAGRGGTLARAGIRAGLLGGLGLVSCGVLAAVALGATAARPGSPAPAAAARAIGLALTGLHPGRRRPRRPSPASLTVSFAGRACGWHGRCVRRRLEEHLGRLERGRPVPLAARRAPEQVPGRRPGQPGW